MGPLHLSSLCILQICPNLKPTAEVITVSPRLQARVYLSHLKQLGSQPHPHFKDVTSSLACGSGGLTTPAREISLWLIPALPLLSSKKKVGSTTNKKRCFKDCVSLCLLRILVAPKLWLCGDKEAFSGKAGYIWLVKGMTWEALNLTA